jgi:predicted RNA-binding Zn-ribbon protein involved in translation (DUF1610 family)
MCGLESGLHPFSPAPPVNEMKGTVVASSLTVCPVCNVELPAKVTHYSRFECLKCGATLRPVRSDTYHWIRQIVCWSVTLTWAWMKGWHDASVVFVISFYVIPVFAAWYYLERYFPAKKFERVGSYIQTLGIDSH